MHKNGETNFDKKQKSQSDIIIEMQEKGEAIFNNRIFYISSVVFKCRKWVVWSPTVNDNTEYSPLFPALFTAVPITEFSMCTVRALNNLSCNGYLVTLQSHWMVLKPPLGVPWQKTHDRARMLTLCRRAFER